MGINNLNLFIMNGLIESRNIELWKSLKAEFNIKVIKEKRLGYEVYIRGKDVIIYVDADDLNPESFTHELLHLHLKSKDIYIAGGFKNLVVSNPELYSFISESLMDHVGNCLEHIKMLPVFLEMGFERNSFISDYSVNKLSTKDLEQLTKTYYKHDENKNYLNGVAVDFFIGKFFSAKACPNVAFDYEISLLELEKIDPKLYQVLDLFFKEWTEFDIEKSDPIFGNYRSILFEFTENLCNWAETKNII